MTAVRLYVALYRPSFRSDLVLTLFDDLALQPPHLGRRRRRLPARHLLSLLAVAQDAHARRLGPRLRRIHHARVRARSVVLLAFGRPWFCRWQSGCDLCLSLSAVSR
jgi:hypothetical protein